MPSEQQPSALSVPLPDHPSRVESNKAQRNKPPVWPMEPAGAPDMPNPPFPVKCARNDHTRDGVCCKELKGEDERHLIHPDIIRDVVIGLSDGLTVPFALAAGLSSLGTSKLVVYGGVAELIAGSISMGIGGFLASQAERDQFFYLRRTTAARVARSCEGEIEREVHAVLGPIGVDEKTSTAVAKCLRDVEFDSHGVGSNGRVGSEEDGALKWSKDVGITPFLLKFGEGLEEVPTRRLYMSAFTIGLGYLVGGLIPLIPYFFIPQAFTALMYSCVLTGTVLLIFGAVKARVTGAAGSNAGGLRSYVWGAVSTLMVGGAAAGAAFAIVAVLEGKGD